MFVFVCGINSAEPASAAKTKLIDKGSVTFFDAEEGKYNKYTWKTYKKGNNYVVVKGTMYFDGFGISSNYYLVKTSKTKLYFKATVAGKKVFSKFIKTKLNAVSFYSKYLRPELKSGDMFTG